MYLQAYLPANVDGLESIAELSRNRPVIVGRVGRAAHRLEPVLGRALAAQAVGLGRPMDALLLSLVDEDARLLRQADLSSAGVRDVIAAFQVLRRVGLRGALAAKALGVRRKDDASRLASAAKLDPRIIEAAGALGMTLHHLRWACGKPVDSVLSALEGFAARRPTVAAFKAAMGGLERRPATQVLVSESDRLSAWLGARAQVTWDGEGGAVELTYFSPEELIGLLERLVEKRRMDAAGLGPAEARTLTLSFRSSAEYDYLVGGAEEI
jgi:hypothetical protein